MTTEAERAEIISRGYSAKALVENELLSFIFEGMLKDLWEKSLDSHTTDEAVLDVHKQAVAIKQVRGRLQHLINDAKLEEQNKKQEEDDGKRDNG